MAPARRTAAPAQHAQTSRKGKKAWRKNVDLTQVEEGLDTVRDEITRGGVIAEKTSDELFVLDTAGSTVIQKQVIKKFKPLKADQIIAKRSATPAVSTRRQSKVTDGVLEPASKKRRNGVSREEYERLRKRAYGGEAVRKDVVEADGGADHDPWALHVEPEDPASFLDKPKSVKEPDTLRRAPVSLLEGAKVLPAVARPKGALSYNPVFEDWDQTLDQEGAKEVAAEKKRLEAARAEEVEQARIAAALEKDDEEQAWRTEDESLWEGFESERSHDSHLLTRLPRRKTPAERNKVLRRKKREQEARYADGMKRSGLRVSGRKGQGLDPVKHVAQDQVAEGEAAESSDEEIDDRVLRRRKLGKDRVPEKDLELVLPDELQDSLRLLKPEGNLLKDRFRNMMIQGRVETRKPLSQQKKPKRYSTEKWSYKDWKLPSIKT